ncbi:MAG: DUF4494 family protein [Nanoarchaeota archaeon]|mgnify:CR=1 FL=1
MRRWYTVKVKYTKKIEKDGEVDYKKISESYLLSAVSFTDAEATITKEVGDRAEGEFLVHAMSVTEMNDVFRYRDTGFWYLCKTTSEFEDNGKVTKIKETYMVEAASVSEASSRLEESLKEALYDYKISSVALSPVMDVIEASLDKELSRTQPAETND